METYKEEICANCLQLLANNEGDHTKKELKTMEKTLKNWQKQKYIPVGPGPEESFFSWSKCSLCDCLPGTRYDYIFLSY